MIFARSPYIVTINELAQESTRLELFIWNGTGSAPAAPTYSLSKKIPSSNQLATYYNIAPFLREYFNFSQSGSGGNTNSLANQYSYCNVTYKKYYTLGGVETLIDTTTDKAFDGFGYFENQSNYTGQLVLLTDLSNYGGSNTYYYDCNSAAGSLTLNALNLPLGDSWQVKYTNLNTGATQTDVITDNSVRYIEKVYSGWEDDGNKVEIFTYEFGIPPIITNYGTYYFVPQCECRYEPVVIEFVNRFGGWQREFFYKLSTENVEMENNKFKTNPVPFPNYSLYQPQYQTFNTNAKRIIKANTGWVNENYKQVIEELLLSETIRVNRYPATLRTKSIEKFKSINTKTINYQMEFEMAYDVINSIS
jgi:hypothetical protein